MNSGFVVMHRLTVYPLYTKGQQRPDIFFSQVAEAFVGSRIHEEGRNKVSAAFALLVVNVPTVGEVVVGGLFDRVNVNGLACFHRHLD